MNSISRDKQKQTILINGQPYVATLVFVKTKGGWSPEDAKKCFGFPNFQRFEQLDSSDFKVWFYDDSEWFHILESWYCALYDQDTLPLYQQDNFIDRLLKLSNEYDVFWFSVGDCDYSFNYAYYSAGKCKRNVVVTSPEYNDRVIEINEGEKLPHEGNILNDNDEMVLSGNDDCVTALLELASGLGIKTKYDESDFQGYT